MSGSRRSNGSGHRPSHSQSSSSGYSNMSSIQEIVRPSTSAGPSRVQTSSTHFYSQPGGVADVLNSDRVNRPPSSSSIPPYTSERPPTYHRPESAPGHRPTGSGSSGRPATHASDPPSYHSRTSSQQGQGQGYGQQQQAQQQRPAQQQQQRPAQPQQLAVPQQQSRRQRTSERLRNLFRRDRNRPEGSGSRRN